MTELEKTITGLKKCISDKGFCGFDCPYYNDPYGCRTHMEKDAITLLKAQNEVIQNLLKVGYPHDYEHQEPWIVNYMNSITEVIKKGVRLNNE